MTNDEQAAVKESLRASIQGKRRSVARARLRNDENRLAHHEAGLRELEGKLQRVMLLYPPLRGLSIGYTSLAQSDEKVREALSRLLLETIYLRDAGKASPTLNETIAHVESFLD